MLRLLMVAGSFFLCAVATGFVAPEVTTPLKTKHGLVETSRSKDWLPEDTILVDGEVVFQSSDHSVYLKNLFANNKSETILFGVMCLGSSCGEAEQLYILLMDEHSKPNVLKIGAVGLNGGRTWQDGDRIMVDLGITANINTVATLKDGTIEYSRSSVVGQPLAENDCQWLYEVVTDECIGIGKAGSSCDGIPKGIGLSLRVLGRLGDLEQQPSFKEDAFLETCQSSCRAGVAIAPYKKFALISCSATQ